MERTELDRFERCNDGKYFPQMNPLKVLGAIDDEGQLKEPVYAIGTVTQRGSNVMHGKNHADYFDFQGLYNVVRYLQDFKEAFPALYHVGVGQFFHVSQQRWVANRCSVRQGFSMNPGDIEQTLACMNT